MRIASGHPGNRASWADGPSYHTRPTEGYVGLPTLRPATSDFSTGWALPDGSDAAGGWWGAIRSQANVRAAPTTRAPIVGTLVPGDRVKVLSELQGDPVGTNTTWYRI